MERQINIDAAVNFYKKQLAYMRNYNKTHSDVINKRSRCDVTRNFSFARSRE